MKKYISSIISVGSILVISLSFLNEVPIKATSIGETIFELMGIISLELFALVFMLTTRVQLIDSLFNGLDKSYKVHRNISIMALLFALAHVGILSLEDLGINLNLVDLDNLGSSLGSPSLFLFVSLTFLAIILKVFQEKLGRILKILGEYEFWKLAHKFMILPYIMGLFHYYTSSSYEIFKPSFFTISFNILAVLGVVSGIYSICLYEYTAFKLKYKVEKITYLTNDIIEVMGKPLGKKLKFKAGQFAFFKFFHDGKFLTSHPFSISSSPSEDNICLTIKKLGNHTDNIFQDIKEGDIFKTSKAHGRFRTKVTKRDQIWVSAGVGITPFRSFYLSDNNKGNIDFIYSFRNKESAIYLEELENLKGTNIYLHESSVDGHFSTEKLLKIIDGRENLDILICGPEKLRWKIIKDIKSSKIKAKIHFEYFDFR